MKNSYLNRFICLLLIVVLAFQLVIIGATASETVSKFTVKCDDTKYTLHVIQVNNEWYVKATDLASLGQTVIKEGDTSISFYKKTPSVLLHTVNSNECSEHNSSKYVHLQRTCTKLGVRFYLHGNTPQAEILKTPQQLFAEVKTIFSDTRLPLGQVTSSIIYNVTESAARVWAAIPFVGSGSIVGALTGKDEYDRYLDVMTTMISDGGDISDFLSTTADFNGSINKYADIINKAIKFSKKGGTLYNFLQSKGISDQIINKLIYEYNPYEQNLEDFFKGYTDVAKIVNLKYFLDLSAYYAAVVDMDESTLLCMQKVYGNSTNRYAKNATESAIDLRFGKGYIAISDIVGGVVGDIIINSIDKALEKKLAGGSDNIIGLGTFVYDEALHISDISDAMIYLTICASLQNEIIKYYNSHKNESAYDMRAIALMYLKTTLVAYDYLEFDKDLAGTVQVAKQTINSYLDGIFDYAKTEYAPDYDNSAIINYLNKHINELETSTGDNDLNGNSAVLKIGDHVYFGSASSKEADTWQVINIDGDYALIYNMCMYNGVFDASIHAQTNTISLMRYHTYGSVSWEYSNLRSWLNSRDDEVVYQDVIFNYSDTGVATVPWDSNDTPAYTFSNGYLNEERFTKEEYYLIQPVTHKNLIPWPESGMDSVMDVKFGDFSDDLTHFYQKPYGVSTTTDRMFPLSGLEYKEYVLDNNLWGNYYPNGNAFAAFWLRDSVDTDFAGFYGYYGTHALTVSNGKASSNQADLSSAIRPACYIDMKYIQSVSGTGEFESPYKLTIDPNVKERTIHPFVDPINELDLESSNGLLITEHGDHCSVDGIGTCTLSDLIIPSEYNGLPVTIISDEAFRECTNLISVTIPDSVTEIGDSAFLWCTSLTSVSIANSVLKIENCAFQSCTSLTTIAIPDSVNDLGTAVFYNCKSLREVKLPNNIVRIPQLSFTYCPNLNGIIIIPASVTHIGISAFSECWGLYEIVFEGTIEEWNSIIKDNEEYPWNRNIPANTVICKDGNAELS